MGFTTVPFPEYLEGDTEVLRMLLYYINITFHFTFKSANNNIIIII